MEPANSNTSPAQLSGHLRALTVRLSKQGGVDPSSPEVLGSLDEISNVLDRLVLEHEGLSSELLGVYEQLGVIFEITRELPRIQHEREVFDLFLSSLQRSFGSARVSLAKLEVNGDWTTTGDCITVDAWLDGHLETSRESTRGFVERRVEPSADCDSAKVMLAPIFAGGEFVCAILLARQARAKEFRASDLLLVEALGTFCGDLIRNHRLVDELSEMSTSMVRSLVNAVDQKDPYTSGHSIRVGYFASSIGEKLGQEGSELRMLRWSALLHDVGKIGIRDDVLKKCGPLTDEEFDHIREHPVRSHQVVKNVRQLAGALDGVLYHHEHYDGTGYPSGLAAEQIPLQARIIQIADVFDALTSTRSYRDAYAWPDALDVMNREAGKTVDPELCTLFSELIREKLGEAPDGWAKLIESANRFASYSWNLDA